MEFQSSYDSGKVFVDLSAHYYFKAKTCAPDIAAERRAYGVQRGIEELIGTPDCVDGGFEADTYDAQAQLARAYLSAGRAAEARMIFEDLVTHEPWDSGHIDGLRQALALLNVPDVEAVISRIVNSTGMDDVEAADVAEPPVVQDVKTPVPAPAPSSIEIDLTNVLTDLRMLDDLPATPAQPGIALTQSIERVDAAYNSSIKINGQVVATAVTEVSSDRNTLTQTTTGLGPFAALSSTMVFKRK